MYKQYSFDFINFLTKRSWLWFNSNSVTFLRRFIFLSNLGIWILLFRLLRFGKLCWISKRVFDLLLLQVHKTIFFIKFHVYLRWEVLYCNRKWEGNRWPLLKIYIWFRHTDSNIKQHVPYYLTPHLHWL